jgi:SAM-dependent methyltransferase
MQTINLNLLGLEDDHRVLDLGCGHGRHTHAAYFHKRCQAVGIDLGFDDILVTRNGFDAHPDLEPQTGRMRSYDLMVGDALQLPFADGHFDRLICSEVLEHIPDYQGALAEIWRVMKPGGRIGISVPHRWPEQICWLFSQDYHNTPGGHVRIFKAKDLRAELEALGFTFQRKHLKHGLHSPYWWLRCAIGVNNDRNIFVRAYKKLLEIEILKNPFPLRALSALADPLMGKSVVLYFEKPLDAAAKDAT